MILDRLEQVDRYAGLHHRFAAAIEFLKKPEIGEITSGRHVIDGDNLFAIVEKVEGRGREQARVEYHQRFIDIQLVISGTEQIGWIPTDQCQRTLQPYDAKQDVGFYADDPVNWLTLPAGMLAIFFPEDGHAPLSGVGMTHKAIVKVAV